jgi:hypothetical protein
MGDRVAAFRVVTDEFDTRAYNARDIVSLLNSQFGKAEFTDRQTVAYPSSKLAEMKVRFTKLGDKIDRIETSLSEAKVRELSDHVKSSLTVEEEEALAQEIIFARHTIEGDWEGSWLSLRNLEPKAPRPELGLAPFPILLTTTYQRVSDGIISIMRRQQAISNAHLILNLLVSDGFDRIGNSFKSRWGILLRFPGDPYYAREVEQSRLFNIQYTYANPDYSFRSGSLIPTLEDAEYYGGLHPFTGRPLLLPQSLDERLNQFRGLGEIQQRTFLRALHWYRQSQKVEIGSKSGALVAAVQAIECLAKDPSHKGLPCLTCKLNPRDGPTGHFKSLVRNYHPIPHGEPGAKAIYNVRSNMTHGSDLLIADADATFGFTDPAMAAQEMEFGLAQRTARGVLINWLFAHASPTATPSGLKRVSLRRT